MLKNSCQNSLQKVLTNPSALVYTVYIGQDKTTHKRRNKMTQKMSWQKVKEYNQTRSNPWYIKHTIGKIEKYTPMHKQTKWEDLTEEEQYYALEQWYTPIEFPEFDTLEAARQYIKRQIEKQVHADVRAQLMFESDACGMMNSCTGYYWYS